MQICYSIHVLLTTEIIGIGLAPDRRRGLGQVVTNRCPQPLDINPAVVIQWTITSFNTSFS